MKVRWSPVAGRPEEEIKKIDENTISIGGVEYPFQPDAVDFSTIYNSDGTVKEPGVREQTDGAIESASRDSSGELHLVVRRFYPGPGRPAWDDLQEHQL